MSSKKPDQNDTSSKDEANNADELTVVVEELLENLSTKFQSVSNEMFAKMDEMSRRLENLEAAMKASQEREAAGSPSKPQ